MTTTAPPLPAPPAPAPHRRGRRLRRGAGITAGALVLATGASYVGLRYIAQPDFPVLYSEQLAAGATSSLELAPVAEALSFARTTVAGSPAVLLVTSYSADTVTGVPVLRADGTGYTDAIAAVADMGYPAIAALAGGASGVSAPVSVPTSQLLTPLDAGPAHVAMGTNYADHAEETGSEEVFLFPKRLQPTASRAVLPVGEGLLDYEVELALVPLSDMRPGDPAPESMGLVLANDFTDREMLLDQANPDDLGSGDGFVNAKSQPGLTPIGDLLVVPADWRAFYQELQLELYVDGQLRQRASPTDLIVTPDEMPARVFEVGDRTWDHFGVPVTATEEVGTIGRGSMVMTGTPAGVTFRPPDTRQIALGVVEYAASLGTNADSVVESAVGVYVREAHHAKAYLQPGQQVVSRVQRLGQTVTDIVPGERPTDTASEVPAG